MKSQYLYSCCFVLQIFLRALSAHFMGVTPRLGRKAMRHELF